eukprot:15295-Heterococcus_DN1.PRE.3
MHPAAQRVQLLRLYKQILRNAAVFPSIKRNEMYEAIRIECIRIADDFRIACPARVQFREGAVVTEAAQVQTRIGIAVKGLEQLRTYTNLKHDDSEWVVDLDANPLGQGKE